MKEQLKKSFFLPEVYNEFIIGFDAVSESIMYDYFEVVLKVKIDEDGESIWDPEDDTDKGKGFWRWFKLQCKESKKSKLVPPTLL